MTRIEWPVVRDWSLLNGLVLNSGLTIVQLKSIKYTPRIMSSLLWKICGKMTMKATLQDVVKILQWTWVSARPYPWRLLEVCLRLLSVCFSVVYFQLHKSDSPHLSFCGIMLQSAPFFLSSFVSKLTMLPVQLSITFLQCVAMVMIPWTKANWLIKRMKEIDEWCNNVMKLSQQRTRRVHIITGQIKMWNNL